jgi:hypothetical protein
MSKPSGNQTVTTKVDADTASRQNEIWNAAKGAQSPYTPYQGPEVAPMHPWQERAYQDIGGQQGMYGNYANQGAVQQLYGNQFVDKGLFGANALAGDPNATKAMMNPYLSGVVDQVKSHYGDLNAAAQMGINDQATKAGAFGGSRHGVASGIASAEIAKGLGDQVAQLQHAGFNDAMGRAGQLGNLGILGGRMAQDALGYQSDMLGNQNRLTGQQYGMGADRRMIGQQQLDVNRRNFNEQRDWALRNLDILRSTQGGFATGNTQSQPLYNNGAAGFLGGAATGAGIGSMAGGPLGAGIGAVGGGVLSLF